MPILPPGEVRPNRQRKAQRITSWATLGRMRIDDDGTPYVEIIINKRHPGYWLAFMRVFGGAAVGRIEDWLKLKQG